ncbi:MAG: DUF2179 domain-containing protein [Candidatus Zixiibacteriota bacterium]
MFDSAFMQSGIFQWLLLPLMIFLARIIDVSLGTIRIILVSRSRKALAALLGFIEVFIWLLAIGQILNNLSNWVSYLAYPAGFAAGTLVGMWIEEKIAIGMVILRVVTRKSGIHLSQSLQEKGYYITRIPAESSTGKEVSVLYVIVQRAEVRDVINHVIEHNPKANYSVQDIRGIDNQLPIPTRPFSIRVKNRLSMRKRKAK